jgi:TM2 domain-containing membrane protein YozV
MNQYYIADGVVPRGPYTGDQIVSRGLPADRLVWTPGMSRWRRADRVEELIFAGALHGMPPHHGIPPAINSHAGGSTFIHPPAPVYNPSIINTNRLAAGLAGILLGGFGIHKFVLGMPKAGVIMLLLTVVGGFITCGTVSAVVGVIGLIEGVLYLTRNDPDFSQLYMVQKKQWF